MSSFSNLPIPKLFDDRPPTDVELAVAKQLAADQCLRWSSCGKTTRARLVEQARRVIKAFCDAVNARGGERIINLTVPAEPRSSGSYLRTRA